MLEIGIGVSASLVPLAFRSLDGIYWALAPSLESIPGGNGSLRFLTSFLILIVPTFLMGGTLPVLARFFTEAVQEVQRKVGSLYALNTFGAAAGTLAAALFFVPQLGITRSTLLIAVLNIGIGATAMLMASRHQPRAKVVSEKETVSRVGKSDPDARSDRLVLAALATSGFVSMIYEVSWTRALSAMIGSSTYAFSIMLVTFLVGIAAGSSIAVRWRGKRLRLLGLTQLGAAVGALLFLVGYLVAPHILIGLLRTLSYTFPAVLTSQFIVCASIMILSTVCMGAALPVASQIYSNKLTALGRSIGNLYSVNTLGAIAGSLAAGFVLLPVLGTERTIIVGMFLNAAMAGLILAAPAAERPRDVAKWGTVALMLVATLTVYGRVFWSSSELDRGVLLYARTFEPHPELSVAELYSDTDVVYFKDGNNATISVRRGEGYVGLRTNGKVDASNGADMITQLMLGYLPILHHPAPRSTMIIGYGGGITVGAVSAFKEVEEIDCLEIEPAVVGAGPQFAEFNRKSYENPKVHIMYNDARNYMNVTRKQYDVIISEPSNPWIAGVASLFTSEFYEKTAQVLKPDGVFAQWIQLYELDPRDLRMILREVQDKFPHVSVWVSSNDLIIIGTRQPQHLNLPRWVQLAAEDPFLRVELLHYFKVPRPEGILAYYVMGSDQARKFSANAGRNSDDLPLLEFHAPRQLFRETLAQNTGSLYENKDGLVPEGTILGNPELAYSSLIEPFLNMERQHLANQAMETLSHTPRSDDASLHLAIAQIAYNRGELANAEAELVKAKNSAGPGNPWLASIEEMWALTRERLGDTEGAIEHFKASAAVEPQRELPLKRLAELYGMRNDFVTGIQWMERYVATKPVGLGHQYATLGDYYFAASDVSNALRALETGLQIDGYSFWARYRLAQVLEEQNDIKRAVLQYEAALRNGYNRDPTIYGRLSKLYKSEGRTADAVKLVKVGMRIFPKNLDLRRLYAEISQGD